jgi:hypothetical protein
MPIGISTPHQTHTSLRSSFINTRSFKCHVTHNLSIYKLKRHFMWILFSLQSCCDCANSGWSATSFVYCQWQFEYCVRNMFFYATVSFIIELYFVSPSYARLQEEFHWKYPDAPLRILREISQRREVRWSWGPQTFSVATLQPMSLRSYDTQVVPTVNIEKNYMNCLLSLYMLKLMVTRLLNLSVL